MFFNKRSIDFIFVGESTEKQLVHMYTITYRYVSLQTTSIVRHTCDQNQPGSFSSRSRVIYWFARERRSLGARLVLYIVGTRVKVVTLLYSDLLKMRNLVTQMEKKLRMAQLCLMQSQMMMTEQPYTSMSLIHYCFLLLFRFMMGNDLTPTRPSGALPQTYLFALS